MSTGQCYSCYDDGTVMSVESQQGGKKFNLGTKVDNVSEFLQSARECLPAGFKEDRQRLIPKSGDAKPIACAERFKVESSPNQTLQWVNFSVTLLFAGVVTWFLFRGYGKR